MYGLQAVQGASFSSGFDSSSGVSKPAMETVLFHKAINATAIDLYQHMSKTHSGENKNFIFFTPTILASLSMIYAGAPEGLKQEMEASLHMGELKDAKWHSSFQEWSEGIQQRGGASAMMKAQQAGFKFQQTQIIAYGTQLTPQARSNLMQYGPEMFSFTTPEEAKRIINDRVSQKTEGKIPCLVEKVGDKLVLLMASAAIFKGQWEFPFEKGKNSKEVFFNGDGTKARIEMMNKGIDVLKCGFDYNDDKNYNIHILELPFHGNLSLLFFKPEFDQWRGTDIKECARQLQTYMTEVNIQNLLDHYDERMKKTAALTIGVPKLDFREKTDILKELEGTRLSQMIKEANFTGSLIQGGDRTRTPELISEINFTMDEEGAAIAAASYSPTYRESCDPKYKLNGPFGLALVDRTTQSILGMGQVLQMAGEKVEKK